MPNLINYFDTSLKNSDLNKKKNSEEACLEKQFIYLLTEYLLTEKNIIENETSLILKRAQSQSFKNDDKATEMEDLSTDNNKKSKKKNSTITNSIENLSDIIYEDYIKSKQLTQLVRLFEDRKFTQSKLNSSLLVYLTKNLSNILIEKETGKVLTTFNKSILIQAFLIAPLIYQNQDHLLNQIVSLNSHLNNMLKNDLLNLSQNFDENKVINAQSNLEMCSFLLSLNIWSLVLFKNYKLNDQNNNIKTLIELLEAIENITLKNKEELSSSFRHDFDSFEKCLNHLLRSFNFYLIEFEIKTSKSLLKDQYDLLRKDIQRVVNLIKNELSSPYHENRLNCLNILNFFYFKSEENEEKKRKSCDENNNDDENLNNIFDICIKAEETQANLDDYRQKLYYLQRLDHNACAKFLTEQTRDVILSEILLIS